MPLPRTDRHSWKIHLARLAGPPGDGVVFWRWLAEQLFPDWSGGLAGSSVSLRPSPRSCRSLPFLRSRSLPSRHVRFFLSLSLFPLLRLSLVLSADTSRNRLPVGTLHPRQTTRRARRPGIQERFYERRGTEEDSVSLRRQ